MNAGVTRAGCVLRLVRTLQARIAAPALQDSLYPVMARTVKVQADKEMMCVRKWGRKNTTVMNTPAESSTFFFNRGNFVRFSDRLLSHFELFKNAQSEVMFIS